MVRRPPDGSATTGASARSIASSTPNSWNSEDGSSQGANASAISGTAARNRQRVAPSSTSTRRAPAAAASLSRVRIASGARHSRRGGRAQATTPPVASSGGDGNRAVSFGPFRPEASRRTCTTTASPSARRRPAGASLCISTPGGSRPRSTKTPPIEAATRVTRPRIISPARTSSSSPPRARRTRTPPASAAARLSPGSAVTSTSSIRIVGRGSGPGRASVPQALQQRARFEQRQAHDVRIGPDDPADERGRPSLDGVAAGLAAPLAASEVAIDFVARESFEGDDRRHYPRGDPSTRRDDGHAAMDAVARAGQQREAPPRLVFVRGLGKDAAATAVLADVLADQFVLGDAAQGSRQLGDEIAEARIAQAGLCAGACPSRIDPARLVGEHPTQKPGQGRRLVPVEILLVVIPGNVTVRLGDQQALGALVA